MFNPMTTMLTLNTTSQSHMNNFHKSSKQKQNKNKRNKKTQNDMVTRQYSSTITLKCCERRGL